MVYSMTWDMSKANLKNAGLTFRVGDITLKESPSKTSRKPTHISDGSVSLGDRPDTVKIGDKQISESDLITILKSYNQREGQPHDPIDPMVTYKTIVAFDLCTIYGVEGGNEKALLGSNVVANDYKYVDTYIRSTDTDCDRLDCKYTESDHGSVIVDEWAKYNVKALPLESAHNNTYDDFVIKAEGRLYWVADTEIGNRDLWEEVKTLDDFEAFAICCDTPLSGQPLNVDPELQTSQATVGLLKMVLDKTGIIVPEIPLLKQLQITSQPLIRGKFVVSARFDPSMICTSYETGGTTIVIKLVFTPGSNLLPQAISCLSFELDVIEDEDRYQSCSLGPCKDAIVINSCMEGCDDPLKWVGKWDSNMTDQEKNDLICYDNSYRGDYYKKNGEYNVCD